MAYLRLHKSLAYRFSWLVVFFGLLLAAVTGRIFTLAIVEHRQFVQAAENQYQLLRVLASERGVIYFQSKSGELTAAAMNKTFHTLAAVPKETRDPAALARELAAILGVAPADIEAKLAKKDDPYEIIARKLDDEKAAALAPLLKKYAGGLILADESRRIYPQGSLASALIGFVRSGDNNEERGEYGLEKFYDPTLAGERGFFEGEKDAAGYWVALGKRILNPPVNGESLVLTVDPNIQFRAEEELDALMKKWEAESGSVFALDPTTGKILAFASRPTFDPNEYSKVRDYSRFRAPLVDSQFELGSVFKPVTMAAGLNENLVTASTTYNDPGRVAINGYTISNFDNQSHGIQTMTQVLEKSLNTGAMFVEQKLGKEKFLEYVKRFGFGQKTGIDLPNEVSGNISNLPGGREVDYATASFGQGIAVTPVQMAVAVSAIANRGMLMKPYVVEKIVDDAGSEEVHEPQAVGQVIRPDTAETLTKMLISAVRNGFENRAGVNGYFVAGKTGTAEIPLQGRRGYSQDVIHTFVGYAPAFNPKFLIYLELVRPRGNLFAANTLTPSFHNLAEFILNYYEIPPDEK